MDFKSAKSATERLKDSFYLFLQIFFLEKEGYLSFLSV
jgi:hypothetical protein